MASAASTRLGVVHRLDKDTSGLMVFARTAHAKRALATQFREHTIDRVYHAIAHGVIAATRVECRLETGRQHQIRIHLSELGHPLVGERVYIRDYAGLKIEAMRPMVHARTLGFMHPRTGGRVLFQREPPADFQATIDSLRPRPIGG